MNAPIAASPRAAAQGRWWIEAAGRVWGPYPQGRMAGFVGEGRLTASSLVASCAQGPFAPAALEDGLARLFLTVPQPGAADVVPAKGAPGETAGAPRPVLVFAALKATRQDLFEAALAAQGESVRVAPGLWLVRARCGAAPLRNLLSRRLREGDVLVAAEVDASHAAWFALPGETDRALRRLMVERPE